MKKKSLTFLSTTLVVFVLFAFTLVSGADKTNATRKVLDPANMDLTVRPGDDFYQYANGNWLKNNPLPEEYSRWGNFEILGDQNLKDLRTIMESASQDKNAPENSNTRKVGNFYTTAMDEAKIAADGAKPLDDLFRKINAIKDKMDLQNTIAYFHTLGFNVLFRIFESQDPGNSEIVIATLFQGGLGMRDRDYYLEESERSKTIRQEYVNHISRMFQLLQDSPEVASQNAALIMALETRLAKASMTRLAMRDPKATYNPKSIAELESLVPEFDFISYFKNINVENPGNINVSQPEFFREVGKIIAEENLNHLKTYLRWCVVRNAANYLSNAFVDESFHFNSEVMTGAKKKKPRWKYVISAANLALGEALGQVYVEKFFPPEAKKRAYEMVMNLKQVLAERIKKLAWMSPATKQKALEKLAAFTVKIGYPDKWTDYSTLEIKTDSYWQNMLRAQLFDFKLRMSRIGKAPDRSLWGMTPQTVNAGYDPQMNEIMFPAAILQPPFFDFQADNAINYGGIGGAIGHEMTHGFDDEGQQFDKDGNLKNWWTEEDNAKFKALADLLSADYDRYVVVDDVKVNGKLTLGENIADLGGLSIAYDGLMLTLNKDTATKKIDGFTPTQRFFIAWAQVWRNNSRKEYLQMQVKTDPHTPGKFRAFGPLVHLQAFYDAFDIKPGDKLYRPETERIKIW